MHLVLMECIISTIEYVLKKITFILSICYQRTENQFFQDRIMLKFYLLLVYYYILFVFSYILYGSNNAFRFICKRSIIN